MGNTVLWFNFPLAKGSSLKRWQNTSFLRRRMYILANRIMLKGSLWNPVYLWDEAKEMMVMIRPITCGKYVFFFHLQLSPVPSQEWYRSVQSINFIHGNVLEWEKRVIWIFGFPHVWIYTSTLFCWCSVCSFTVPNADYTEEMPALLMLTLSVLLHTALQNPVRFCFCPTFPSSLFLSPDCCWSSSVEEGVVGLYPSLPPLWSMHSYTFPRKTWSRMEQNYSTCGAIGSLQIPVWDCAMEGTVPG